MNSQQESFHRAPVNEAISGYMERNSIFPIVFALKSQQQQRDLPDPQDRVPLCMERDSQRKQDILPACLPLPTKTPQHGRKSRKAN